MPLAVEHLMSQIEDDVRHLRRKRLLARGGAGEYRDPAIYAGVDEVLRRAIEARDHDALLVPDFLSSEADWNLSLHLKYASHRPAVGRLLIAAKRRLLLPVMRWLYEYSLENFRKQRRINTVLFACIEELAIENARLRQALEAAAAERRDGSSGSGTTARPADAVTGPTA
ncbi:MAG TPA: hypothetical protein VM032_02485 [Vicinamibacterales bacterium]|nr:hypothetical protein [Vicinamibacterales bacterium]